MIGVNRRDAMHCVSTVLHKKIKKRNSAAHTLHPKRVALAQFLFSQKKQYIYGQATACVINCPLSPTMTR